MITFASGQRAVRFNVGAKLKVFMFLRSQNIDRASLDDG